MNNSELKPGDIFTTKSGKPARVVYVGEGQIVYRILKDGKPFGPSRYCKI